MRLRLRSLSMLVFLSALAIAGVKYAFVDADVWHRIAWESEIRGPVNSNGFIAYAVLRDAGLGPSADWYADIVVREQTGETVARIQDRDGQGSYDNVIRLMNSIQWANESILQCDLGVVKLGEQE